VVHKRKSDSSHYYAAKLDKVGDPLLLTVPSHFTQAQAREAVLHAAANSQGADTLSGAVPFRLVFASRDFDEDGSSVANSSSSYAKGAQHSERIGFDVAEDDEGGDGDAAATCGGGGGGDKNNGGNGDDINFPNIGKNETVAALAALATKQKKKVTPNLRCFGLTQHDSLRRRHRHCRRFRQARRGEEPPERLLIRGCLGRKSATVEGERCVWFSCGGTRKRRRSFPQI